MKLIRWVKSIRKENKESEQVYTKGVAFKRVKGNNPFERKTVAELAKEPHID